MYRSSGEALQVRIGRRTSSTLACYGEDTEGFKMASEDEIASTALSSNAQERGLPSLGLLAILCVAGLATGWSNSRVLTGASEATIVFRRSAWFTVWSALGALAVALYLILGCITLRWLWLQTREEADGRSARAGLILKPLFGFAVYGAAIGAISAYLSKLAGTYDAATPLAHFPLRVNLFVLAAIVGAAPSAVSLWITRRRARSLPLRYVNDLPNGFEQFQLFRQRNQRSLSALSAIVAMAVFQTSALRNALVGSGAQGSDSYPAEFIILYGLIFAIAIAVVYLPSEFALRDAGFALQDVAAKRSESGSQTQQGDAVERWLELGEYRDRIGKTLNLNVTLFASVRTSLGLLAPLFASLLTTLFPH